MVVVLPYLFFVILPLYALIFALSAEAAVRKFYRRDAHAYKKRGKEEEEADGQWNLALPNNDAFGCERKSTIGGSSKVGLKKDLKSVCSKCIRMVLLGLCAVTAFIHFGVK
jgi:ribosomal protein L44E